MPYDVLASVFPGIHPATLFVLLVWTMIWKGLALWKSARKDQPVWFVALLVISTVGILEILYIFIFSEMGKSNRSQKKKSKRKK